MEFESAYHAADNIKAGWNLGNALDSHNHGNSIRNYSVKFYETLWNSPVITKELIRAVKAAGFSAVRLPVTWYPHTDGEGNIKGEWMERVGQVAGYILDEGLYCIVNMHHDGGAEGWLCADKDSFEKNSGKFVRIWEQIAVYFRDRGEKLLFEGFNEMLDGKESWTEPSDPSAYEIHNAYNRLFVETVRKTGGNNAFRNLSVQTYSAGETQRTLDNFILPPDSAEGHIIAQVHNYDPQGFCWKKAEGHTLRTEWGNSDDREQLDALTARLKKFSERISAPVIIGEYGSQNKENEAARAYHGGYLAKNAYDAGIKCFWWDTQNDFGIFDRNSCALIFPEIARAVTFR